MIGDTICTLGSCTAPAVSCRCEAHELSDYERGRAEERATVADRLRAHADDWTRRAVYDAHMDDRDRLRFANMASAARTILSALGATPEVGQ